jgi:hypothetical protein
MDKTMTTKAEKQLARISTVRDHYLTDLMILGEDGLGWYERANSDLCHFASAIGDVSVQEVADVTAILSPRCSVQRNCIMAAEWFVDRKRPEGSMQHRWDSIVAYYQRGNVGSSKALKIRAFAKALGGDYSACVNDTHIASAFGLDYGKDGLQEAPYNAITRRIERLARRFSITTCDAQAALWVGWRKATGQQREGDYVADLSLCDHLPVA